MTGLGDRNQSSFENGSFERERLSMQEIAFGAEPSLGTGAEMSERTPPQIKCLPPVANNGQYWYYRGHGKRNDSKGGTLNAQEARTQPAGKSLRGCVTKLESGWILSLSCISVGPSACQLVALGASEPGCRHLFVVPDGCSRRHRLSLASLRSTTHRRGSTSKWWLSGLRRTGVSCSSQPPVAQAHAISLPA